MTATATRNKIGKIIGWAITFVFVAISLALSLTYFRAKGIGVRVRQSGRDFAAAGWNYLFNFTTKECTRKQTVQKVPAQMLDLLPMEFGEFQTKIKTFGNLLITKSNVAAFAEMVLWTIVNISINVMPIALAIGMFVLLYIMITKCSHDGSHGKRAKDRKTDEKAKESAVLKAYQKTVERYVFRPIVWAIRWYIRFLKDHRIAVLVLGAIWFYNLNFLTIITETVAFCLYLSVSIDIKNLYYQALKFSIDILPAITFFPWFLRYSIAYAILDVVRNKIGKKRLKATEKLIEKFLEKYLGALFFVGGPRKGKTTTLVNVAKTNAMIMRKRALAKMAENEKLFPNFPWINLERAFERAFHLRKLPTLSACQRFIRRLREGERAKGIEREKRLKWIKEDYGYIFDDFLFGYDVKKYGRTANDGLQIRDVFDSMEYYIQHYYIYSAPTSLIMGNLSVRDLIAWEDYGNFPRLKDKTFDFELDERDELSVWCHVLDQDSLRLKKVMEPDGHYKDAIEVATLLFTEIAKERLNQFGKQGLRAGADECNQKNDGWDDNQKMIHHGGTVENQTYIRELFDEQRPGSWEANGKDLTTICKIREKGEFKCKLPLFGIELAFDKLISRVYDKWHENHRVNTDKETLISYAIKKIYGAIHGFILRRENRYAVAQVVIDVFDGMSDEALGREKIPLSRFKVYSGAFETAAIQDFYRMKSAKSDVGINDVPVYHGSKMSVDEMEMQHSYFYDSILQAFSGENAK